MTSAGILFLCPAEPIRNAVDVSIDGQNLMPKRIHHNASGNLV